MLHIQPITKNYLWLFENMSRRTKIELINWLSSSLLDKEDEETDDFFECFGAFKSEKSAEEQIEAIRSTRYFVDKEFQL